MTGSELAGPTRRLFVGLPGSPACVQRLMQCARQLAAVPFADRLRWVPPANCHLTLAFLGQIADSQQAAITRAMSSAAREVARFELSFDALVLFPSARRPRVLAAIPQYNDALADLHERLHQALSDSGFVLREGPYRPHLSLARIRGRRKLPEFDTAMPGVHLTVPEIVLFESVSADGPVQYRSLHRLSLLDDQ